MGRAAARLFASEGARVAIVDVDRAGADETLELIRQEGGDAFVCIADVADAGSLRAALDATISRFGSLHVLYNNAGIWLPTDGAVTDLDEGAWHRTLAVNLTGVFHCCRYGIPALIDAGGGSIINTSSPVALRPDEVFDAYTASKGGVISLTLSIARHYAPKGIRANVLLPGAIATPMTEATLADPEARLQAERQTLLGRWGRPEEVAKAALFLASDESSFVTGSLQYVDGGWAIGP
jgi:NAD(P)-dependent dehydrogenase (short-subunit alcohol dehydrogenase family)